MFPKFKKLLHFPFIRFIKSTDENARAISLYPVLRPFCDLFLNPIPFQKLPIHSAIRSIMKERSKREAKKQLHGDAPPPHFVHESIPDCVHRTESTGSRQKERGDRDRD